MEREAIIEEIVEREWAMFQDTQNIGGRASCQDDRKTFEIMRKSQAVIWPDEALESWRNDLEQAGREGRNLIAEKYARMMESTSPEEYEQIRHLLPELSPEVKRLAEQLTEYLVKWAVEAQEQYPGLLAHSRPIRREQDIEYGTSIETYSLGEFETYSEKTLRILSEFYAFCDAEGRNLHIETLRQMMESYGFESLEQAEAIAEKDLTEFH